jgi:cellulose synthase/poly-beta-1,6-N-acetylglucosamine synthase-like glycosyltransferase
MEYVRYQQSIARRKAATAVLSGTATAFRVGTLRRLKAERGFVYDESSMLEDYEISLALRHRGLRCVAPTECRSYTDVMPSVGRLWRQRLRWQRGTIEELRHYGFTRVTRRDVGLQLLVAGAVLSRVALVAALALTFAFAGGFVFNPLVIPMAAIIAFERAWTIRSLGWRASLAGLLLVFEEGYGVFRETFWCRSLWLSLRRRTWEWHPT